MLNPSTLKFLKALQKNNNKPWFDANRNLFEEAKEDFLHTVEKLIPAIAAFDPGIANLVAKNCTFRINRDVRFSKNKLPYKNNMAAYFNKEGKKGKGAGYYLHVEPGRSFVAAGIWMPEPGELSKIRQELDYNLDEWNRIMGTPTFKKTFGTGPDRENALQKVPKGYEANNPAAEFLKLKSFVVSEVIADTDLVDKKLISGVSRSFKTAQPFVSFLNRAVD